VWGPPRPNGTLQGAFVTVARWKPLRTNATRFRPVHSRDGVFEKPTYFPHKNRSVRGRSEEHVPWGVAPTPYPSCGRHDRPGRSGERVSPRAVEERRRRKNNGSLSARTAGARLSPDHGYPQRIHRLLLCRTITEQPEQSNDPAEPLRPGGETLLLFPMRALCTVKGEVIHNRCTLRSSGRWISLGLERRGDTQKQKMPTGLERPVGRTAAWGRPLTSRRI